MKPLPAFLAAQNDKLKHGKRKRNPSERDAIEDGEKLFRDFSGMRPQGVRKVNKPKSTGVLVEIGTCDGLMYTTVRDGETERYIHKFAAKSRPTFAVSSDGKQLYLLGGAYNFTERGIVDKT